MKFLDAVVWASNWQGGTIHQAVEFAEKLGNKSSHYYKGYASYNLTQSIEWQIVPNSMTQQHTLDYCRGLVDRMKSHTI